MAYVDTQIEFSDSQAVTATAISSNVYDLFSMSIGASATDLSSNTRIDVGSGEDIYLVVNTAVLVTDTSSDATLTITLETADDVGLSTNMQVVFSTGALAFAAFSPAGTNLVKLKLPSFAYRRYIGLRYTVASGPLTAGAFDAFITNTVDAQRIYKSGFTVQ
jgi:hypothetical protein